MKEEINEKVTQVLGKEERSWNLRKKTS